MGKMADKMAAKAFNKPSRRILNKPKQKKNPNTGNTSTAPAANEYRQAAGERLKEAGSPGPQKAYDRIQGEIKWLKANGGSPESIAKREQSLKDMYVTKVIKKKPMKDVKARVPADASADVKAAAKDKELDADVAKIMEALNKRKPQAKARGGVATKRMGSKDYRKGGMVLSTVNNKRGR